MRYLVTLALLVCTLPAARALACDSAYYPLKEGANWKYNVTKGGNTSETTEKVTKVDGSKVSMEASVKVGNGQPMTMNMDADCTADGLEVPVNMGPAKTTAHTGMTLLSDSKLTPGATWEQTMDIDLGVMGMGSKVKITHKVIGTEKVKVPAGEFDALKIEDDNETQMTGSGPMASLMAKAAPQKTVGYSWYAKGVGLVKSQAEVAGKKKGQTETQTTELVSYGK